MRGDDRLNDFSFSLILSTKDFFTKAVGDALETRNIRATPLTAGYLVEILERHVVTEHLFDELDANGKKSRDTLAELYFKAQNSDPRTRIDILKKLGDRSLYISGFFGDSLQRKVVDIDYYINMGGAAYATLADQSQTEPLAIVFAELSSRFLNFVEVFSFISEQARLQDEANILRLYEIYAKTGSDVARQKLHERGLIAVPIQESLTDDQDKH